MTKNKRVTKMKLGAALKFMVDNPKSILTVENGTDGDNRVFEMACNEGLFNYTTSSFGNVLVDPYGSMECFEDLEEATFTIKSKAKKLKPLAAELENAIKEFGCNEDKVRRLVSLLQRKPRAKKVKPK